MTISATYALEVENHLAAKRNLLFEQFLAHPSQIELVDEITLIQTRMAELTSLIAAVQKSDHN